MTFVIHSSLLSRRTIRTIAFMAVALGCVLPTLAHRLSAEDAKTKPPITAMAVQGNSLLCGSQQGVEVVSLADKTAKVLPPNALTQIHDLQISADRRWMAAAGGSPGRQGSIELWNGDLSQRIHRWDLHKDLIYRVAFSAEGKRIATAGHDGYCKIVERSSGKTLTEFAGHSRPVMAIAFLPGDELVVSAGVDQTIQVWKSSNGQGVRSMDNHTAPVNDLALKPQQKTALPVIATASEDRTVRLWQPTIGRMLRFAKLASIARALCWNPEGTALWVGCDDGQLVILDPETLDVVRSLPVLTGRIHALMPHPDGKRILCAGEGGLAEMPR